MLFRSGVVSASRAAAWFEANTHEWAEWTLAQLMAAKADHTVSLVVPARNEAGTVGDVVGRVREALVDTVALIDEIVVHVTDGMPKNFPTMRKCAHKCSTSRRRKWVPARDCIISP